MTGPMCLIRHSRMAAQVVDMNGCVGAINTFVVEPFVPHAQEYYLCIQVRCHTLLWKQHQCTWLEYRHS